MYNMDIRPMVMPVDIVQYSAEITLLLRRSFIGVAEDLGLTEENRPYHVAFMTEERLLMQLHQNDTYCRGIRENGEWAGFVAVVPYHDTYEITRLAVAPECRHKGYGKALVECACEVAKSLGLDGIGLGMINENTVLKKWYETLGFVPGEPFRPQSAPYTVCGMRKQL